MAESWRLPTLINTGLAAIALVGGVILWSGVNTRAKENRELSCAGASVISYATTARLPDESGPHYRGRIRSYRNYLALADGVDCQGEFGLDINPEGAERLKDGKPPERPQERAGGDERTFGGGGGQQAVPPPQQPGPPQGGPPPQHPLPDGGGSPDVLQPVCDLAPLVCELLP